MSTCSDATSESHEGRIESLYLVNHQEGEVARNLMKGELKDVYSDPSSSVRLERIS